ncbi:MAG TPA: ribose 5-phosphate isomerase B [bacterium]|jgi:ribose 5-phosphate isomerase B|nr:ribose 5-phosphate isomerase B [bacterium]HNZ54782.1 ribose 5-phosphate isomerase B [bacterium]HOG44174.1 ribose 5-phosphate isomerase B [bacterium]HPG35600.1 ribose 5-phosphate isomerase B [bacterium]HPM47671.1 ribose 5-phosphate isomerase B [bacterium]
MKISIGADHGGFELKTELVKFIKSLGHTVIDNGTNSPDSVDYPDYAKVVAHDILEKRADFGVLICGSGIGISIAANRFKGIRAALVTRKEYATLSRQHNNANIIAFGGRFIKFEEAKEYLEIFLLTPFEGGRHEKRVCKIDD